MQIQRGSNYIALLSLTLLCHPQIRSLLASSEEGFGRSRRLDNLSPISWPELIALPAMLRILQRGFLAHPTRKLSQLARHPFDAMGPEVRHASPSCDRPSDGCGRFWQTTPATSGQACLRSTVPYRARPARSLTLHHEAKAKVKVQVCFAEGRAWRFSCQGQAVIFRSSSNSSVGSARDWAEACAEPRSHHSDHLAEVAHVRR